MDFEIVFEFFEIKELSQAPRIPQGSRSWPRGLQIRSKIGLKIDQNFDAILVSFLVPLGSHFGCLLGPFWDPNRSKICLGDVLSSKTLISTKSYENQ